MKVCEGELSLSCRPTAKSNPAFRAILSTDVLLDIEFPFENPEGGVPGGDMIDILGEPDVCVYVCRHRDLWAITSTPDKVGFAARPGVRTGRHSNSYGSFISSHLRLPYCASKSHSGNSTSFGLLTTPEEEEMQYKSSKLEKIGSVTI